MFDQGWFKTPWKAVFFFALAPPLAVQTPAKAPSPDWKTYTDIRVRIGESLSSAWIRGLDLRISVAPLRSRGPGRQVEMPDGVSQWDLSCRGGSVYAVERTGGSRVAIPLNGVARISSPSGVVQFRGNPVRGEVSIIPTGGATCDVVNSLPVETYLEGVIAGEFNPEWSAEAVAAQAVAARTYSLYRMKEAREKGAYFDVEDGTGDQVFSSDLVSKSDYRSARAIARTRGTILSPAGFKNTVPIKAFFHSTCGGETEAPAQVWGLRYPGFGTQGVRCPFCGGSPRFRWEALVSSREVGDAIAKAVHRRSSDVNLEAIVRDWPAGWQRFIEPRQVDAIEVGERRGAGATSRAEVVRVTLKNGSDRIAIPIPASRLRDWLGPTKIRSTLFEVSDAGADRWAFRGRGNGHGVGMCQWGAKTMAERGVRMAQILRYYYPGAVLRRVW